MPLPTQSILSIIEAHSLGTSLFIYCLFIYVFIEGWGQHSDTNSRLSSSTWKWTTRSQTQTLAHYWEFNVITSHTVSHGLVNWPDRLPSTEAFIPHRFSNFLTLGGTGSRVPSQQMPFPWYLSWVCICYASAIWPCFHTAINVGKEHCRVTSMIHRKPPIATIRKSNILWKLIPVK